MRDRYSIFVGLAFLAVALFALINTLTGEEGGTIGLNRDPAGESLPEFAVPAAFGAGAADANIAQDDCEVAVVPCPVDARRTPACRIRVKGAIRVCDFFGRPLVISFWFTRGGDCEAQQDAVDAVSRRYRGRVGFLSLNVRDEPGTVREIARRRGWTMPLGYDRDGAVSNVYRVGGCPTFVYAYPGGIAQGASIGELDERRLSARVRGLLRATVARGPRGEADRAGA